MSDLLEGLATGLISGVQGGAGASYDILKSQREDEQKMGLESRLETMRSEIQVERAKRLEEAKNAMRGEQGRKIATEQEGLLSAKVQQQADAASGTPGASEFVKSEMGASERDTESAYLQAARKVGAPEQEKESADRLRDIERGLISGRQFDATESNRQRQHEENLTEKRSAEGRAVSRETASLEAMENKQLDMMYQTAAKDEISARVRLSSAKAIGDAEGVAEAQASLKDATERKAVYGKEVASRSGMKPEDGKKGDKPQRTISAVEIEAKAKQSGRSPEEIARTAQEMGIAVIGFAVGTKKQGRAPPIADDAEAVKATKELSQQQIKSRINEINKILNPDGSRKNSGATSGIDAIKMNEERRTLKQKLYS